MSANLWMIRIVFGRGLVFYLSLFVLFFVKSDMVSDESAHAQFPVRCHKWCLLVIKEAFTLNLP